MGRLSVEISILSGAGLEPQLRWVSDTSGSVTLTAQRALWASATHGSPGQPSRHRLLRIPKHNTGLHPFPTLTHEGFPFHLCSGSRQDANRAGLLRQPAALASHQSSLFDLSEMTFKYYLENQYSLSSAASAGSLRAWEDGHY